MPTQHQPPPLTGQALIDHVARYAPIVRLHPNESYFPMDPLEFIRHSRFRRHYDGFLVFGSADHGYDREARRWFRTNSHHPRFYNIPVTVINGWRAQGGRTRRPYDRNAVSEEEGLVFLETRDNVRGHRNPTNRIPVFFRIHGDPQSNHYWIQFFLFYGYNDSRHLGLSWSHQGDWEHVIVEVREQNFVWVGLNRHTRITWHRRADLGRRREQPIVYAARGTHALYPTPGRFNVIADIAATDFTANGGDEWDTSKRVRPLASQPWRDFAGAWGEVGEGPVTTGPSGPAFKAFPRPAH